MESELDRLVVDEVLDGLPVREFRSYAGQRHYSGWFFSATMGRLLVYESLLELSRLQLADFDHDTVGILGQPFQLIGADGRRIRRHVPDILLSGRDGTVTVVDVKPAYLVEDEKVATIFEWTRLLCARRGWRFEVYTGAARYPLENIRFLLGYRRAELVRADLIHSVLDAVGPSSTLGEVERRLNGVAPAVIRPVILHLLWTHQLTTNLGVVLGSTSVLDADRRNRL
ncbi:TnsA-like heteromeric transposase endonuclease subunit [Catenulispora rubra]|uniref:TnsA-like heteromeric transposase endonuclease subunit n=1 Tax=Catenulispora rubra TaxID=280293 RepID=UPI002B26EBF3|nr:TnsA-like heteromeric transposase endonuclease subunit [Catenulispora rubra]